MHYYDVLRANKVGFGGQIEVRFQFLERDVLEVVMNTDPYLKLCNSKKLPDGVHPKMEKYLLRKAFDTP